MGYRKLIKRLLLTVAAGGMLYLAASHVLLSADGPLPGTRFHAGVDVKLRFADNLRRQADSRKEDASEAQVSFLPLSDYDLVAPEPDAQAYGEAASAADMEAVLEKARSLRQEGDMLFTVDTPIKEGSTVRYYADPSIFAVTWKQVVDDSTYTFSEILISDPSQIRRFFSEGTYESNVLHTTTEMSESVNAVVASSGDFFGYRRFGIVVNEGQVYRDHGLFLDTCFIDDQGDLLFTRAGELLGKEAIQAFVDENNVRFSVCFGPLMIENGEYCVPGTYNSGEINDPYARAALCQLGKLHYVVVAANNEAPNYQVPTVASFGRRLQEMGIPTAYALDGGQTASIVMNDQLINSVSYGSQRKISDILYFATAVPNS